DGKRGGSVAVEESEDSELFGRGHGERPPQGFSLAVMNNSNSGAALDRRCAAARFCAAAPPLHEDLLGPEPSGLARGGTPMPLSATYVAQEPTRDEVNRLPGPVLLEFGTAWCGYCRALDADLAELLEQFPQVRHLRVEDGRGKPLGRSFRVKL